MVGATVVERLADGGTRVVGMDTRRPSGTRPRLDFRAIDLRDQADVWESVHGPGETRTRSPREDADLASDDLRGNAGSWVDVRDLARLVVAVLAADRTAHETVLCAADENCLGPPTADIVETVCGTLPERCDVSGREAALSNGRARERFGWRPVYPDLDGGDGPETPAWV
jgi:nucleoside-diphosphate-sugar epimerase